MITVTTDSLEITLPLAAALLAFASKDDTRPHLGVGIDEGNLCATDGYRAVQFSFAETRHIQHGKVWSRAHVETLIKVAKAHKWATIALRFADALPERVYPPQSQVMPNDGIEPSDADPIGFNPDYVGALKHVVKACGAQGAMLSSLRGSLDPIGFRIDGTKKGGLAARVAIMPMRI